MVLKSFIHSAVLISLFLFVSLKALAQAEDKQARPGWSTNQYKLVDLEHFSTDIWQNSYRRDPYQPEYTEEWTQGGQFNFDLRVARVLKWKNGVHMDGTESQLRNAGWQFEVTTDYYYQLRPFYMHHSEHALDKVGAADRFPVVDRYGINICWLGCR